MYIVCLLLIFFLKIGKFVIATNRALCSELFYLPQYKQPQQEIRILFLNLIFRTDAHNSFFASVKHEGKSNAKFDL